MPPSEMTARRAAWIGLAWVNGSVLVAYGLGFAVVGWVFATQKALLDKLGP